MIEYIETYPLEKFTSLIRIRKGEVKLGERIYYFDDKTDLSALVKKGVQFVLLGIPESIGIMANHGKPGAERSWSSFLKCFLNIQNNRFLEGSRILCLGHLKVDLLQQKALEVPKGDNQYITKLRQLCQSLDQVVAPVIKTLVNSGLVPIVIGGGHNNSYPIIKGCAEALDTKNGIACLNLDAHADFRPMEGRHSGNCFSYAFYQRYLARYHVMGLHQSYNSESMLKNMDLESAISYQMMEDFDDFDQALDQALHQLTHSPERVGLELDMDSIEGMPSSAFTPYGVTIANARDFVREATKSLHPLYFHVAEASIQNISYDQATTAKTLACLVTDFIKTWNK
ncbi:MAG: formimidoylglutamase [Cyclobacteriaceae bacterium]